MVDWILTNCLELPEDLADMIIAIMNDQEGKIILQEFKKSRVDELIAN
jgi:hypothetical protein